MPRLQLRLLVRMQPIVIIAAFASSFVFVAEKLKTFTLKVRRHSVGVVPFTTLFRSNFLKSTVKTMVSSSYK